jgi:type IV pilus assembly protein PilZ
MASKKTTAKNPGRSKKTAATTSKSAEADAADGRSGRRIPIQLLVDYKSEGNYLFDFCRDLGTGGVFIQTNKPLPTGSSIDLTFTIPDSKETLTTKGTVIWVQGEVGSQTSATVGMGVQFAGFSGDQRKMLEDFVKRYHGSRFSETTSQKAG